MQPLSLLVLLQALALPLGEDLIDVSAPLGMLDTETKVQTSVTGIAPIEIDVSDVGLFLQASLPGPSFSIALPAGGELVHDEEPRSESAVPFPLPEPQEAAGAAAVGTLSAIAYGAFRLRYLGPWFILPLYSRLKRSELLENEVRQRLLDAVTEAPGLSLKELCKLSGAGWGTTVYHLQRLEQAGMVSSRKQGHHRRFYLVGEIDRRDVDALGILRNETPQRIAQYLIETPGANQKQVCEALGISPSLAHKHLKRLEEQKLLTKEREWRTVKYTPDPRLGELVAQAA